MINFDSTSDFIEAKREPFFALSDCIWAVPETNYRELRSSQEHTGLLEQEGFRLHHRFAGLPTAVMGEAGMGGPIIAILGELDFHFMGRASQPTLREHGNAY